MNSLIQKQFNEIKRWLISFSLMLIAIISPSGSNIAITNALHWKEVPSTEEGRQWWDQESLRKFEDGTLNVSTRFTKVAIDPEKVKTNYYLMQINCKEKQFRDLLINRVPILQSKWKVSEGDELIENVINEACYSQSTETI